MSVMLFSGGMDSVMQDHFIKADILLYIDIKGIYSEQERKSLKKLPEDVRKRLTIVELPLGQYERRDLIIPFRNVIFASIAFQYSNNVYMGFNEADMGPDKSPQWLVDMSVLYASMSNEHYNPKSWEFDPMVSAPFNHHTKAEMLKHYVENDGNLKVIQNLRSCYHPTSVKGCGKCSPCTSKAVALLLNTAYHPKYFDDPVTKVTVKRMLERRRQYRPTSKELKDYETAIAML